MSIESKTIRYLLDNKISVSTAESCTGGLLASKFTAISGISKIYESGFITYSDEAKIKYLKVSIASLKRHGAVSRQICSQMCFNLHKISKSHLTFSTTGIAGPGGGTKSKPVGLVYIGVKKGNKTQINKCLFKSKKRSLIQKSTVNKALKLVLRIAK